MRPQCILVEPLVCALDIVFPCLVDAQRGKKHTARTHIVARVDSSGPHRPARLDRAGRTGAADRCASRRPTGAARRPRRRARSSRTRRARQIPRSPRASPPARSGAAATRRSCAALTTLAAEPRDARAIARAGLDSMRRRLVLESGGERGPARRRARAQPRPHGSAAARSAARGARPGGSRSPTRAARCTAAALREQLQLWVDRGIVEPSFARAVALVVRAPRVAVASRAAPWP